MSCITVLLRLRPDKKQQRRLCETLEICRETWNRLMYEAIGIYLTENRIPSVYDLNALLPPMKEEHPEMWDVHSLALQNISFRVNTSLSHSDEMTRPDGEMILPKMRTPNQYRSFEFPSTKCFSMEDGKLFLGKMKKDIGGIRYRCGQKIQGDVKTCVVIKKKNHWYARITCEILDRGTDWFGKDRPPVGIDLGLINRITLSDGTVYKHERYEGIWKEIKKIQRKMSELEPGTARYEKLARRLRNRHQRIVGLRTNELRHVAKDIVDNHEMVAMEDIDIKKLIQNEHGKGIHCSQTSASWGNFRKIMHPAAEASSTVLVEVDPRGTSQNCSGCGRFVAKDLSIRTHNCPFCGLVLDRDVNAAINILAAGRAALASSHRLRG